MVLDVRVGIQYGDRYIVMYVPLIRAVRRPIPLAYLSEKGLLETLRGLEDLYGKFDLTSLTRQHGVSRGLTTEELKNISNKL